MANSTPHTAGATRKARREAWLERQKARWAAVPDQVRANRRQIAEFAMVHPAVASLSRGSVAQVYAMAAIRRYAESPVRTALAWDSKAWAFDAALSDLATREAKQDKAVQLGRRRAEKALKESLGIFHESCLQAVKAELAAAS